MYVVHVVKVHMVSHLRIVLYKHREHRVPRYRMYLTYMYM